MVYIFDGFNYIIRLDRGEHLSDGLHEFMRRVELSGAWVEAIGGAQAVELGFYNLESKQYQWKTFEQKLEIASLQGSLTMDTEGQPMFHLHGVLSNENYQTIGGHVKDLVVGGTCEIFVHRSYKPLKRHLDAATGLKLLNF